VDEQVISATEPAVVDEPEVLAESNQQSLLQSNGNRESMEEYSSDDEDFVFSAADDE
jgi:hypothetical protein